MSIPQEILWRLAKHEAAHAIVALAVGAERVVAVVTAGAGGEVRCRGLLSPFARMMVAAAGPLADDELEIPAPADLNPDPGLIPSPEAFAAAAPAMAAAKPVSDEELIDRSGLDLRTLCMARNHARRIIDARRGEVLTAARALAERGTIRPGEWGPLLRGTEAAG